LCSIREVIKVIAAAGREEGSGGTSIGEPFQVRLMDSLLALFEHSKVFLGQVMMTSIQHNTIQDD
jgi:hypothetical protein